MKKLIIFSHVFIWIKGGDIIFYNSKSFDFIVFKAAKSDIISICQQLNDPDNLYEVQVDQCLTDHSERDFVDTIVSKKFGCVLDNTTQTISLPPLLNIQTQIKNDDGKHRRDVKLEYFTNLTIYPGGGNRKYPDYFRQTYFPIESKSQLQNESIMGFLENNRTPYLQNINIVVSCIDKSLYELMDYLKDYSINTVIYILMNDQNNISKIKKQIESSNIHICLISYEGKESNNFYIDNVDCEFHFLVRSEEEYEKYESDLKMYGINNYSFIPIYDNNLDFFEKNIFLSEEDIKLSRLSKRHIFINQSINSNFFGSFTIMPDGKIHSNVNKPAIGSMSDEIYTLIEAEMRENHAWRSIRNQKPCSDCLYQWLCPSPSNYEIIMGRQNLCLIR